MSAIQATLQLILQANHPAAIAEMERFGIELLVAEVDVVCDELILAQYRSSYAFEPYKPLMPFGLNTEDCLA